MAAPFSRRLLVASAVSRAWALKTAGAASGRKRATKKAKKESTTTMRFELTRFCWELIPDAEKMDFYVSHFLTGIISREKLAAEERSPVSEKR